MREVHTRGVIDTPSGSQDRGLCVACAPATSSLNALPQGRA